MAAYSATFNTLSGVLEHLIGIYTAAKEKQAMKSLVIQDCQELFKPWPKKKTRRSETTKDDHISGVDEKKEETKKKENDMETKMLSEVELMLAKAQKTRDILDKTDQAKELPRDTKQTKQKQIIKHNENEREINTKTAQASSERHDGNETPQSGVISQSELNKLLADTSIKSSSTNHKKTGKASINKGREASINKGREATVRKEKINKASASVKQLKSKPVVKMTPVTRKQYSTSASEIGKHSKRNTMSKVTSSYSQKSSLSEKSTNERTRTGSANTNRQHSMRGNRTAQNVQVLARKIMKNTSQVNNDRSTQVKVDDDKGDSSKYTETPEVEPAGRNEGMLQHGDQEEMKEEEQEEVEVDEQQEEAPFLLRTEGTKLKFPSHIRKLYNTQEVLINKVSEIMSRSGRNPACQNFLDRVNSQLLGNNGGLSLYDHDIGYQKLKHEYQQLIHKADQQILAVQQVSDESRWQDIYKIKVNIELIQNRLHQLLTEIQDFEQKEAQYHDIIERAKSKAAVTNNNHNNLPSNFILPSNNQDILDDIFPQGFSQVKIEYGNLKDLQRLVALQLELQVLYVEQQTQKLLSEEMLPILAAMDKNDSGFIQCYRSLYGLLCHRGEQFPTMVVDEIDEN